MDGSAATGEVTRQRSDIIQRSSNCGDVTRTLSYSSSERRVRGVGVQKRKMVKIDKTVVMEEKSGVVMSLSAKPVTSKPVAAIMSSTRRNRASLCRRILLAALPFYIFFALLFLLAWMFGAVSDDGLGCLRQNNYAYSFTPMLSYTNGPPPA